MKSIFGLHQGFDFYDEDQISTVAGRRADQVTDRALEWLQSAKERRFFLFLNYYDPHLPYTPPEELARAFLSDGKRIEGVPPEAQEMCARYDAEVRFMDQQIGRLLDQLREWEIYGDAWIIVTADHGEALGEHGTVGHGFYLFQEEVRIPLFIKYPAGEETPARSSRRIQLTDILPLVCQRVGIPVPAGIQGGAPPKIDHPIVAEAYPLEGLEGRQGHWRAIFEGDYKFLWNSLGRHKLFNLRDDPEESLDLAPDIPHRAEKMSARLEAYLASLPGPAPDSASGEVDEETRRALENLGYLE
jgi:arylsulfatase A-like enzyme